jgi:hypothetical protein
MFEAGSRVEQAGNWPIASLLEANLQLVKAATIQRLRAQIAAIYLKLS